MVSKRLMWLFMRTESHECDGVPTYQLGGAGGPGLFRHSYSSRTKWVVASSSHLAGCDNYNQPQHPYFHSLYRSADGAPSGYEWRHGYGDPISVVAASAENTKSIGSPRATGASLELRAEDKQDPPSDTHISGNL